METSGKIYEEYKSVLNQLEVDIICFLQCTQAFLYAIGY